MQKTISGGSRSKSSTATKTKAPAKQSAQESKTLLEEFFVEELKDIYWAEKHLIKALPKMQKATSSEDLGEAFAEHLEVTRTHVERLEEVFELLEEKPRAKKCEAMEGLVKEGEGIIEETDKGTATRDVGLILAAQKIEHYEIATYGGLAQLAKTIGRDDIADILTQTLEEEKEADATLTSIAEAGVNDEAEQEGGEEEEE